MRIKDIIIDTFMSVKQQLNPNKRKNCFELFGYDFLIDEDLRIWLIEVNTNPYFGIPNDYISNLLPKMQDDMFKIVLDPVFPAKTTQDSTENGFELLYCEHGSDYSPEPVNKRQPFTTELYPNPELKQVVGVQRVLEKFRK